MPSTTTDNIRNHLQTVGLGGEVSDIQELRSRDFTKKSFCVTSDNVTAENKSYEVKWPRDVVVRPYRTYQKQAKRGKSPANKGQGQSNKHSAPRGQTYSTDTSNKNRRIDTTTTTATTITLVGTTTESARTTTATGIDVSFKINMLTVCSTQWGTYLWATQLI